MIRRALMATSIALALTAVIFPSATAGQRQGAPGAASLNDQLAEAVAARDTKRVAALLKQGADPNYVSTASFPIPVLAFAILRSDTAPDAGAAREVILQLRAAGASADPRQKVGALTMEVIAVLGREGDVALVADVWPDLDIRGPNGATLLMLAAGSANDSLARELLRRGADPCKTDATGRTAAGYARQAVDDFVDERGDVARDLARQLERACEQRRPN